MLANGMGARQLATRIALYCDANEAMSAEEVPGMPLASAAPGAPAVEPPMADGHTGAAGAGGGVGVELGTFCSIAGVEETLRTVVVEDTVAVVDFVVVVADSVDGVAPVLAEPVPAEPAGAAEPDVPVAAGVAAETEVGSSASDATVSELSDASELANVRPAAAEMDGVADDPAPWTRRAVATSAVAANTAVFNVCTPIQRLHCPPN
jgi:hypothetical protein